MWCKISKKIAAVSLLAVGLNIVNVGISPAMAAETQGVTCVNRQMTEKKYVGVEYVGSSNTYCRTIYNNGFSPTKEIAWGRNGITKCAEVAGKLVTKLSRAGMNCSQNKTISAHLKPSKHLAQSNKEDEALLKSIEK